MSDSIFNRPRRQEPRVSDERGRDFRDQSHTPDQGGAERRDPGADALSELARMIAGTDPIPGHSDAAHKSGGRLADVTRTTLDRGVRREPDFGMPRSSAQPTHPDADYSETSHASDNFDFLRLPNRDDYAVAPQHAVTDEEDHYSGYGRQDEEYADEYHDDQYGHDEDHEYGEHDEPGHREPVKRRRTAKVAVMILGLAVFGSAAAFGYRTIFKAAPSGPTPIIHADNSPTKVAPAATEASAKPTNGPLGNRSGEQLVRRDEEPVDVGAKYGSAAFDSGGAGSSPPDIVPATAAPPASPAPAVASGSGDPKRVHTVQIRPDQGQAASDRTPSRAVPPPQSQPASPPPQRQAAVAPPQRQAAAVPPPPYIPPAVEEGRGKGAAPVAAAPDAPSRATDAGGFVVQVSAQRSEADAQTAFRTLQAKYAMLGGHEPLIRRKDLGERGIFFAAQVGPFGVKGDADQLCESLKAAGGACFVQRN